MSGRGRETRAQRPGPGGVGRPAPNDQSIENCRTARRIPHVPQIREIPAGITRTIRKS